MKEWTRPCKPRYVGGLNNSCIGVPIAPVLEKLPCKGGQSGACRQIAEQHPSSCEGRMARNAHCRTLTPEKDVFTD